MNEMSKPQILCVDDDARLIKSLVAFLSADYEVHVASSAEQALQMLRALEGISVVISDMRMPGMDGATFLHELVLRRPDVARILLTGHAEGDAAARAVNQGQIFRFLTKPCSPDNLRQAIEAGVINYRLANAERAVLQETLLGCIHAMMEVLAIVNPVAFGRAAHIKRRAMELATRLRMSAFWQLEAAAMLSQLGYSGLPAELVDKICHGSRLTPAEQAQVDAIPDLANKLLEHIPRLEPVIQILSAIKWPDSRMVALGDGTIGLGARILGLILEYDALSARGLSHDAVCDQLCGRTARYGAKLISQLDACIMHSSEQERMHETLLRQVLPGMILLQEIRAASGALIVPNGFTVTKTFLERISNIAPELLDTRVRVNEQVAVATAGKQP
jgi:CheY-like chemotaxis protein